jgi:hypothetical protein
MGSGAGSPGLFDVIPAPGGTTGRTGGAGGAGAEPPEPGMAGGDGTGGGGGGYGIVRLNGTVTGATDGTCSPTPSIGAVTSE